MTETRKNQVNLLEDFAAEKDAFGPHQRVADAIADMVATEAGGKAVAVIGTWGSGNRPDRVVIVLDREERHECCGMLSVQAEGLLAQGLAKENLNLPVSVVLANRQFECWLLANTTALDSSPLIKEPISPHLAGTVDELDVLSIIKSKLKRGCGWDKPRYGKALAQRLDIQDATILNRSRSLRKFVKELSLAAP